MSPQSIVDEIFDEVLRAEKRCPETAPCEHGTRELASPGGVERSALCVGPLFVLAWAMSAQSLQRT